MFGTLGLPEILFILVLALLVFGPRRLPEMGRTIGKALGEFRRATGDLKRTFDRETSAFERGVDADTFETPAGSGAVDRGAKSVEEEADGAESDARSKDLVEDSAADSAEDSAEDSEES